MIRQISPLALREALVAHGLAPHFQVVETSTETLNAARTLGVPVIVRPAERYETAGTRIVEHVEDVSLAFAVARRTGAGAILVESFYNGPRYYVCGTMAGGKAADTDIAGRVPSEPPHNFDWCIYRPADVKATMHAQLIAAAETACQAVQWTEGTFCADIVMSERGPMILGLHSGELLEAWFDAASNIARGMAVAWVRPRSGVVTDVIGIQDARDIPGVLEVHVATQPGDVIGHTTDEESRNRAGYVRAVADTGKAALTTARRACACIRIETRPTL